MANNRMLLICNVCMPPDTEWSYNNPALLHIAKWYPDAPWYPSPQNTLGDRLANFLELHAHPNERGGTEENPIRLEYETWVRDMPAIKKWEV